MPESNKINPQVTETEIGIRNLRIIKIYPLSIADQLQMTDLVTKAIVGFFKEGENPGDIAFVGFVTDLIKDNIGKILSFVTDEKEDLLKEITNNQLLEVVRIIWVNNYEDVLKNGMSLFEKAKNELGSKRQSPISVKNTQDTDLSTSTQNGSKTEE